MRIIFTKWQSSLLSFLPKNDLSHYVLLKVHISPTLQYSNFIMLPPPPPPLILKKAK